MKKLIITAHPSKDGFTHKIAKAYQNAAKKKRHEVKVINLYQKKPKEEFFSFEDKKSMGDFALTKEAQKNMKWATEYVFIFPVWWYDSPAIMKNFIDYSFSSGFAYKFSKNGFPKGLLGKKRARIFCTADGPTWIYTLGISPLKRMWKGRFNFCSLDVESFTVFGNKRNSTPKIEAKWLKKVEDLAVE